MGEDKDSSKKIKDLEKAAEQSSKVAEDQANTIAKLENEIKKLGDPNKTPKIIQKGSQVHPKYQRNKNKISATIAKEEPIKK